MKMRGPAVLLPILLALFAGVSLADEKAATITPIEAMDTAQVKIDGVELFPVRGVMAYPAERRARDIEARIESIAKDKDIPVTEIHYETADDHHEILAGKTRILAIVDADAALIGIDRKILADVYVKRIREIITEYRYERSPKVLLVNGAYVVGATLLFVLVIWGLRVGFRRIDEKALQRFEAHLEGFKVRSVQLLDAGQVKTIASAFLTTLRLLVFFAVIYFYMEFALSRLPWTRGIAFALIDMVLDPLKTIGNGILDYTDNLIFLVVLILVLRYFLSLLQVFFSAVRGRRIIFRAFEPEWAWPTYRLVRILVFAFGVVVAYPYIPGSSSDAFKGVTLFLGVLFSLGSSSVISNVIAGYTMTYRRAFKVGDRVKIGENIGDVEEIRLLVTHLRSLKNEDIVIPNSSILNAEITNYSTLASEQGLILHTTVGIGYEVPWRQVEAMLLLAAKNTKGILTEPKPFVLQKSLGDYAVNYELNCYCDDAQQSVALCSALHANIQDVFNEYQIQIMTPSYMADTPEPKMVSKDKWYSAPAKQPDAPPPVAQQAEPSGDPV